MMSAHEWFEQLSALGVTGNLEPEEFRQLGEHLYECASCRALYQDFHAIIERGLPTLQLLRVRRWSFRQIGMKKRFLERARKEGIPFESSKHRTTLTFRILATTIAVGLVVALVGHGWHVYRLEQDRYREATKRTAVLSGKVAELEEELSHREEEAAKALQPALKAGRIADGNGRPSELEVGFARLRNDYDSALAGREQLQQRVSELVAESDRLRGESQSSREEIERLHRNLREAELTLSRTNRDLESVRNTHSTDASTIAAQRAQIERLTATTREQTDAAQRERELLRADKDIRDLMGARNLRIVDVQDVGTPSRVRSIPGRIFYTQGKSLIFYAYDLQNRGNVSKVDFQVWGKKEGRSEIPRSLGIFYVDEATQNRWVLKFEDADLLAQIDQIFVTAEPRGGSQEPTGKKLLTAAFLNETPNHP